MYRIWENLIIGHGFPREACMVVEVVKLCEDGWRGVENTHLRMVVVF